MKNLLSAFLVFGLFVGFITGQEADKKEQPKKVEPKKDEKKREPLDLDGILKELKDSRKDLKQIMELMKFVEAKTKVTNLILSSLGRELDSDERIKATSTLVTGLMKHHDDIAAAEKKGDLKAAQKSVTEAEALYRELSPKLGPPRKIDEKKKTESKPNKKS
jgi:hypothetical protein